VALDYNKVNVASGINTSVRLNSELEKIQTALEDGLSRSGSGPNEMSADLDMGGQDIINAGAVQCDSITVGGEQIASVAALAAEADRAVQAATEADAARDEAVQAAASLSLPLIQSGDQGKALIVNSTEDGYEYSAPIDPAVAIAAAITDQPTAEAGTDNDELMTPLRTKQAVAAQIAAADFAASISTHGTARKATAAETLLALTEGGAGLATAGEAFINPQDFYTGLVAAQSLGLSGSFSFGTVQLGKLLIQWGRVSRTGQDTLITFHTAFAAIPVVVVTSENTSNANNSVLDNLGSTRTTTQVNVRCDGAISHINWIAIGPAVQP
jgi:hypothetical protein